MRLLSHDHGAREPRADPPSRGAGLCAVARGQSSRLRALAKHHRGGTPTPDACEVPVPPRATLFDPNRELDSCGIGFVAETSGRASREILDALLEGLRRVRH